MIAAVIPALSPALLGTAGAGAGVVLALAGWWWARHRTPPRIGTAEEAATAAETLPGFAVSAAVVGADGAGALAVTADGRVAAIACHGRRLIAREVAWRAVRSTVGGILVETGDSRMGEIRLAGVDVLDIRRLAPRGIAA